MTRVLLAAIVSCGIAGVAIADSTTPKGATATKKAAAPPAQKTTTASVTRKPSTPPSTHTPVRTNVTAKSPVKTTSRPATNARYYARRRYTPTQQTPTSDRYREIQDALAAKGYLKTPPSGVWDRDSIDAMQRFQQDQKLEPTGKLTARSLGALGLGPTPAAAPASSSDAPSSGVASPEQ